MPNILIKDSLRQSVEQSSQGYNTVLYDNVGLPNIVRHYPATKMKDLDPTRIPIYAYKATSDTSIRIYINCDYKPMYSSNNFVDLKYFHLSESNIPENSIYVVVGVGAEELDGGEFYDYIDVYNEDTHNYTIDLLVSTGSVLGYICKFAWYSLDDYHPAFISGSSDDEELTVINDLFIGKYLSINGDDSGTPISYIRRNKNLTSQFSKLNVSSNSIQVSQTEEDIKSKKGSGWGLFNIFMNDLVIFDLIKNSTINSGTHNQLTSFAGENYKNLITTNGLDSGLSDFFGIYPEYIHSIYITSNIFNIYNLNRDYIKLSSPNFPTSTNFIGVSLHPSLSNHVLFTLSDDIAKVSLTSPNKYYIKQGSLLSMLSQHLLDNSTTDQIYYAIKTGLFHIYEHGPHVFPGYTVIDCSTPASPDTSALYLFRKMHDDIVPAMGTLNSDNIYNWYTPRINDLQFSYPNSNTALNSSYRVVFRKCISSF